MINQKIIELNRALKKHNRELKRKEKKKKRRIQKQIRLQQNNRISRAVEEELKGDFSFENTIEKWMPQNIIDIISKKDSQFNLSNLLESTNNSKGVFLVPENFSIVDNPKNSYKFIREVFGALLFQTHPKVVLDYSICQQIDLGAQTLLDIILLDVFSFYRKCRRHKKTMPKVINIGGCNIRNKAVSKMLFSVGSPATLNNEKRVFPDIIPYRLCIYKRPSNLNSTDASCQKAIDTTILVDYVLNCLKRLDKSLTPEKLDDLCTVISEILINAEEHSSYQKRYSIGYFHETNDDESHYGVFRLVILNFGESIYSKFKSEDCPNKDIVAKMENLSKEYTSKGFFRRQKFQEETLWTLYSLQEGVTTVSKEKYKKRGHGSIRFIESFFNIKGNMKADSSSKMAILSGNTSLIFDGKYNIVEKTDSSGENFKIITFNESDDISDAPDEKYVKYVTEDFPGTLISAKIIFNEDDIEYEIKS